MRAVLCLVLLALIWSTAGCGIDSHRQEQAHRPLIQTLGPSPVEEKPSEERNVYDLVVLGARQEVVRKVIYDASYLKIDYPGGDVPPEGGACTDVVVRAFRHGGIDLQKLIHEDMRDYFELYPQNWGLQGPDTNIDHRRVPNQMRFFT